MINLFRFYTPDDEAIKRAESLISYCINTRTACDNRIKCKSGVISIRVLANINYVTVGFTSGRLSISKEVRAADYKEGLIKEMISTAKQ